MNNLSDICIDATNVLFFRICFVYGRPCPAPAFSWIRIAAYPVVICSKVSATKLKPLPGAEYGGLSKNTLAGKFSSHLMWESSRSNLEDPSPMRIMFSTANR